MNSKRKHVVFSEDTQDAQHVPDHSAAPAAGPFIHPSRAPPVPTAQPAEKKPKSATKKRYLAAKARRQRKLKSAKKAAAPKNKLLQDVEGGDGSSRASGSVEPRMNAEAGPSTPIPLPATSAGADEEEAAAKARRKREKREKRESRQTAQATTGEVDLKSAVVEEPIIPGGVNDEAAAKEQRKREKREKREARRVKREQEELERTSKKVSSVRDDDSDQEEEDTVDEVDDSIIANDDDPMDHLSRSASPPPLEAFPLPTPAPAPDPSLLSRQGLPSGLDKATFIDQDLRISVSELEVVKAGQKESEKGISERMAKRLAALDIKEFFAVQAAILPQLLRLPLTLLPSDGLCDYLISAPTGSGKTLAYAIPVVEILSTRTVKRLRALIVLPTRDLVTQVRETLETLAKGTDLSIAAVSGAHSFKHEQHQLVADMETKLLGGSSKIDILIATPGRLIDHLTKTPNFTLQHLRFLVIDEADRLLNQSFQNWLSQVLAHIQPPTKPVNIDFERQPYDRVAPAWLEALGLKKRDWDGAKPIPSDCQKLLFSATLTRDPAKVASLALHDPKYYIVQSSSSEASAAAFGEQFAVPSELTERMIVLEPATKPLNLIHLVHHPEYNVKSALVFTKSVESAMRLVKLLEFFEQAYMGGVVVRGYTSEMKSGERKNVLAEFAKGKVHLLVCSDLIARGMDLPSVEHVVSYDIPLDMRKYIHRVGRTARAGRSGTAWSLVEKQETPHFKAMLRGAKHEARVGRIKIKEADFKPYLESYEVAMGRLKALYSKANSQ